MNRLDKKRIIVTRPAHQSRPLATKLRSLGATVIELPTIDIQFRQQALSRTEQKHLAASSLWIFTSVNAVNGASHLKVFDITTQVQIACIGLSTAASMKQLGITPDYVPEKNSNSEGLLKLLQEVHACTSVTIIRGGHGRDTLQRELTARGCTVYKVDVYQRCLPEHPQELLVRGLNALPCPISITSNQGLSNLKAIIPDDYAHALLSSSLIVNSHRCEVFARKIGFIGDIAVAVPPGDDSQVEEFLRLENRPIL